MAGFFTQSGIILEPAARYFGRSVTDTAVIFSYLVGGNLLGIVVSLSIFEVLSIRRTLIAAYAIMFAGIAVLCATHAFAVAAGGVSLVGFGGGLGLSSGAVILSKTYASHQRAIAFLTTDCAFSIAGFVIPAVAGRAIAAGLPWQSGYVGVAAIAAMLLVGCGWVRFPRTTGPGRLGSEPRPQLSSNIRLRIALFGGALALYLCGQSTFLIWSPNVLQTAFALPPLEAGKVVGSFWGPSIFGLIGAALLVTRLAPRTVLLSATGITIVCLGAIATASSASIFLAVTLAFGFTSTCMFKLMISIGSEQIEAAPPQLVTFLLLSSSVGGTLAPVISAQAVRAFGPHAGPFMALGCYVWAFALIVAALSLEKSAQRARRPNAAYG